MNYFNYFTEVEERFQQARNSGMFMMSPLDWVLVESWKDAGIPLEAVIKGIDKTFESYHSRPRRHSTVNSVSFCTQRVLEAAKEITTPVRLPRQAAKPGLESVRVQAFLANRAADVRGLASRGGPGSQVASDVATRLADLAAQAGAGELDDLEDLERRLSALEDLIMGVSASFLSEEQLLATRREIDAELRPYRRKMGAAQVYMLEERYLRRKSLDQLGLERLSLYYMQ